MTNDSSELAMVLQFTLILAVCVVLLMFTVNAIACVWRSPMGEGRKKLWTAIAITVPVIGPILCYGVAPTGSSGIDDMDNIRRRLYDDEMHRRLYEDNMRRRAYDDRDDRPHKRP